MVALTECCIPHGASDEFMLYSFKVLPCTRKGAHSWTECPFTHAGEKAARRCPKTYIYSAEACPDARKSGKCARGDMCPYSHGVFEQWLHPSRYRTQLCSFGTACRRPVCFFAHTVQELRVPTACGPNPTAITTTPMQASAAAAVAAASQMGFDPAAAAVAAQQEDAAAYAALMQQALLAQMTAAAHQQLDGATATMINRYQAASCAALANAVACQRQQQQHQAAAAAAAAAAMAVAANNPASLLHVAQAAQAYQAAAAAAAAAAANVHMPNNMQNAAAAAAAAANANGLMSPVGDNRTFGRLSNASQMIGGSSRSSSSNVSSPTCSSSHNNGSLMSVSTFMADGSSASDHAAQLPITSQSAGALFDNLLLQQALAGAGVGSDTWGKGTAALSFGAAAAALNASPSAGAAGFGMPWLPSSSSALACGGYPSSLMPATPAISDGMQNAVSSAELARQLSMQQGY